MKTKVKIYKPILKPHTYPMLVEIDEEMSIGLNYGIALDPTKVFVLPKKGGYACCTINLPEKGTTIRPLTKGSKITLIQT